MSQTDVEWIKAVLEDMKTDLKTVVAVTADNTMRISAVEANCRAHGKVWELLRGAALLVAAVASTIAAFGVIP